jgi:hypothetical protein
MKKAPAKPTTPSTKARPAPAPAPGHMMAEDMKWKAQDALHTLKRAHEIKNDPALMHHVKQHAKQERDTLAKVIRRKT